MSKKKQKHNKSKNKTSKKLKSNFNNLWNVLSEFASKNYKYLIAILLIYFVAKSLYFIFTIPLGVAPDEVEHFELVNLYQNNINLFEPYKDLPLPYGRTATINGFLYHLLMGKLLLLNFFTSDLVYVRIINMLLATANVFVFYKLAGLFTQSKVTKFFLVIVYTNILMFTFISSAVNYDNLVNLISVSTIFYFIKFTQTRKFNDLAFLAFFLNFGVATKTGYWPLAIVILSMLVIDFALERYSLKELINDKISSLKSKNYYYYGLYLLIILLIVFNFIFLYGKQQKFGRYDPYCENLYDLKTCMEDDPGYQVYEELSEEFERNKGPLAPFPKYYLMWFDWIVKRGFGIFGHRSYVPSTELVNQISTVMLYAVFASFFNFLPAMFKDKEGKFNSKFLYIFLIGIGFSLLLMVKVNYQSYLNYGLVDAGLQSRYLFPALSAIVIWLGFSLTGHARSRIMKILVIVLCAFVIYAEFPQYLASPDRQAFEAPE